jgi:dihydroorotate dehydrogenase
VLIINVSSPNTPGLRLLQGGNRLGQLLTSVVKERDVLKTVDGVRPKVVVKVAPDLEAEDIRDVAKAVKESAVDGVIVSNTTITRPDYLKSGELLSFLAFYYTQRPSLTSHLTILQLLNLRSAVSPAHL